MPCASSRAGISRSPRSRSCRPSRSRAPIPTSPRRRRTARARTRKLSFKIVYDRGYPPNTVDFTPIVRGIQASNPDFVYIASYPTETVGIVRAASEVGLKTKLFGGGMVGLQYAAIKTQLGELLNKIVDYDFYVPEPTVPFKGIEKLSALPGKAPSIGADLLGYFIPPFAYANGQVIEQAVAAVGSLDQKKLGDHIKAHSFDTIVGKIEYAPNGEWKNPRVLWVQYQGSRATVSAVQEGRRAGDRLSLGARLREAAIPLFGGALSGLIRS